MLSTYGMTLAAAAGRGHKSIGRQFLDAGANVNTVLKRDYSTALAATARNGHECIVRQLLDVGANVNIISRRWYGTALTGAAREGRERIVASCSMQALRQGCLKRRLRYGVGSGGERSQVYTAASCLTLWRHAAPRNVVLPGDFTSIFFIYQCARDTGEADKKGFAMILP